MIMIASDSGTLSLSTTVTTVTRDGHGHRASAMAQSPLRNPPAPRAGSLLSDAPAGLPSRLEESSVPCQRLGWLRGNDSDAAVRLAGLGTRVIHSGLSSTRCTPPALAPGGAGVMVSCWRRT